MTSPDRRRILRTIALPLVGLFGFAVCVSAGTTAVIEAQRVDRLSMNGASQNRSIADQASAGAVLARVVNADGAQIRQLQAENGALRHYVQAAGGTAPPVSHADTSQPPTLEDPPSSTATTAPSVPSTTSSPSTATLPRHRPPRTRSRRRSWCPPRLQPRRRHQTRACSAGSATCSAACWETSDGLGCRRFRPGRRRPTRMGGAPCLKSTHGGALSSRRCSTHTPRKASAEYHRVNHLLLVVLEEPCWICGIRQFDLPLGEHMETHHCALEWAMANAGDPEKILALFPETGAADDEHLRAWLDSESNMLVLRARCRRGGNHGVHAITYPAWVAQKYLQDDWDLASGPKRP